MEQWFFLWYWPHRLWVMNKTNENKTQQFGPFFVILMMKMKGEIHQWVFLLNSWRYCRAEWGTKLQTIGRWIWTFIRRSAPLVFYLNHSFFFYCLSLYFFAERTLPTASFCAIVRMSPFKVWTRPFVLITLWGRLSCHHPYTTAVSTTTQLALIEQIKPWAVWMCVDSALTQDVLFYAVLSWWICVLFFFYNIH